VIPATFDNTTLGELQRYENNYKALNLITTALGRNVYDRLAHLKTAHDVWLKLCNTYEGHLKLNLLVRTRTICNIRHFLRNLVSHWLIALLDLSPLLVTYALVVLLLILTMNVSNSCFMLWMIMFGV
jgi:hypothetical protein